MIIEATDLDGVLLIKPKIYYDERGYFYESFNEKKFKSEAKVSFISVQDNQSFSKLGTLRGIHLQTNPFQQAKLIRVLDGEIYDVAVDLRRDSKNYCKWCGEYLSSENHSQLFIPKGFGHAYLVTSDSAIISYKVNNYYSSEHERSIRYDDPKIGINWPALDIMLSDKDEKAEFLNNESNYF